MSHDLLSAMNVKDIHTTFLINLGILCRTCVDVDVFDIFANRNSLELMNAYGCGRMHSEKVNFAYDTETWQLRKLKY